MFLPWFAYEFVPDPELEEADPSWPRRPLALEWLDRHGENIAGDERRLVETACRSPWSVFVIEDAVPGRALDRERPADGPPVSCSGRGWFGGD